MRSYLVMLTNLYLSNKASVQINQDPPNICILLRYVFFMHPVLYTQNILFHHIEPSKYVPLICFSHSLTSNG
jgi:hypothetical protein